MKKTIFTCDHCGKEIDEMRDYPEMKIDNFIDFVEADLCSNCFRELNEIVLKYINKKQGE
jgi:DNA-directed RNA polymerase subunit RPC12/RpoP